MKLLLITLFTFSNIIFSQNLTFLKELGKFKSASSFDIDLNGNIYISDNIENTITKLDSSGKTILSIGGFGWNESTFDQPVSVFTNTLSIYVADKNNNRIQRFDKDLNFLSQYNGDNSKNDVEFGYPTCLAISSVGDLFILDSDNNRILKFNLTGDYLSEIGSNDAGNFALDNPKNFSIDFNGRIFVLDDSKIKVFDQYGNGMFYYDLKFSPEKIYTFKNIIVYLEKNKLTFFNLKERKTDLEITSLPNLFEETIVNIRIVKNILFVLTPKRILKYKIQL